MCFHIVPWPWLCSDALRPLILWWFPSTPCWKTLDITSDYATVHETNMIFRKLKYIKNICFPIVFVFAHKYVGLNDALRPLILLWFLSTPCWKPLYFTSDSVTVHETNMIFWKLKYIKHICFPVVFVLTHKYVGLNLVIYPIYILIGELKK